MKFSIKAKDPAKLDVDILIMFAAKGDVLQAISLGAEVNKLIKEMADQEEFKANEKESLIVHTKGAITPYKLLIAGTGKEVDFDLLKLRKVVARASKKAKENNPKKIAICLPIHWLNKFNTQEVAQATVEAVSLSTYQFLKYKSEKEKKKNRQIEECIIQVTPGKIIQVEKGLNVGQIVAKATCFARDLVNEPANKMTPALLAKKALDIGKKSQKQVKVKVFEEKEIEKFEMGAYLGVSQGSAQKPKFIHLEYKPKNPVYKIVLVGKGITFDTGGLSIKTSKGMESMKMDMAGAAAVLSIFSAIAKISCNVHLVGLIAACENMPSSRALKPGDILKAANGKTIEVVNTDAEGRLTLADVLSFATDKEKPDAIIDIATLTGACMVALGLSIAGLWSNDEKLKEKLIAAAEISGEKVWPMPLESEYKKLIKSDVADLSNVGKGRYAGAIAASLFLKEFVGEDIAWAHIDIAGPAFYQEATSLIPKGGSGFGVRLILHYLLNLSF